MLFQQVKYCGNTLPHRFLSVEGAVQIKFKSDGNGNGQGFKLEYSLPSKIFLIMYYFINLILIYESDFESDIESKFEFESNFESEFESENLF